MENQIINEIQKRSTIIIHRHKQPDLDAYGSQLGLKEIIKENFKDKTVYAVGDTQQYPYEHTMDVIDDSVYEGALVFVLDINGNVYFEYIPNQLFLFFFFFLFHNHVRLKLLCNFYCLH